jgi:hypothetical protein
MNARFDSRRLYDIPDPFTERTLSPLPGLPPEAMPASKARSRMWVERCSAIAVAAAIEVAFVGVWGLRWKTPLSARVVMNGAVLPALAAAVLLALSLVSSARGARIRAAILAGSGVFLATSWLAHAPGDASVAQMLRCLTHEMVMAGCSAVVVLLSLPHAFATGAAWRGACLGLASGLLAAAATRLLCSNDAFVHVVVGHGLPILVAALAAAALGARFTRA